VTAQERFIGRGALVPQVHTIASRKRARRDARRVRKQGHALALHKLTYDTQRIPFNSSQARYA
jgi:hypothetical protein